MTATRLRVFVSSVQKEFAEIRSGLKAFLLGDAVLRRFVSEVFLFEEIPARDQRADQVYIEEVDRCDIYLGLFGYEYGADDDEGLSPTEREYDRAGQQGITRFVYVWGSDEKRRSPRMKRLIKKASSELVRRRVEDASALSTEVYSSFVDHLDRLGVLRVPPFDASVCDGATLRNLSRRRIEWFLKTARNERGFPLKSSTSPRALLAHLNLLDDEKPTNAAVLLFGADPQRFHRPAETKCVHCHGSAYQRPFVSQQHFGGDLFEQADQARVFVLTRIDRAVGTRAKGIQAPVAFELPPEAVSEAVINALVHRDYSSNASVEVRLFAGRLEVWNPGALPGTLTLEDLRRDHASVPYNPLLAESLYLTRYIEKVGSGTQKMIGLCKEAGLPEPDFEQRSGFFVVTIWRDWLTDQVLASFGLNDRQNRAVAHVRKNGRITNADHQKLTGAKRKTAARDLDGLVEKGVFQRVGQKRGIHYVLAKKK